MGFGVWGLGFGVWGFGFVVWGLGFGVWGKGKGEGGRGKGEGGRGKGEGGGGGRVTRVHAFGEDTQKTGIVRYVFLSVDIFALFVRHKHEKALCSVFARKSAQKASALKIALRKCRARRCAQCFCTKAWGQ